MANGTTSSDHVSSLVDRLTYPFAGPKRPKLHLVDRLKLLIGARALPS
jgi:hypothetical protein